MPRELARLDYATLQQCMHCGMCLPTCPTYDATGRERNSPRGRISLMRAIADGELAVTPAFAGEMSYCLGCLACQTACPAGVDYARMFEAARSDVETSGLPRSFSRRFCRYVTLRGLFRHPRLLRGAGRLLRFYQRSGLQAFLRRIGAMRVLPSQLRRLEPSTPAIGRVFSPEIIRPVESPVGAPARHRVLLLTGCMQDLLFADINRATADVLLANDCEVHTPPVQPCCGSLHVHNGDTAMARELARRWLDLVDPNSFDAIVSNAGGCGSHLRHYTNLLGDEPAYRERALAWDSRLRDVHEWLVEIGCRAPQPAQPPPIREATYHESCHLCHGQRVSAQPRALLRLIPGLSLRELPEANWCCGSAGVYSITQPDQAARLLERKVGHLRRTGAQLVATANPGCHLQLQNGLREAGLAIEVVHPISLLADAYAQEKASIPPS